MSVSPINPERFAKEWRENEDVLRRMAANGDRPEIPRLIDVSFRGDLPTLTQLANTAGDFGFSVQSLEADDEGRPWLFLEREQSADSESIRQLTIDYLKIESIFGVECDGWGCIGQTGSTQ